MSLWVNKTDQPMVCENCEEKIETNQQFHMDEGETLCECCYEDRHEYDNEN
ncbi:MAG: hypothetical protein HRT88_11965 [Lentisphaeraceae bacterium]|nr:hypothetical protein [Lentisphaeraceae bacterium]